MANLLPLFCIFSQRIIMSSLINIEIASLNVRGMNDFTKRNLLFSSFEKSKFTVVFLQETKIDPSQHIEISNEWQNGPIFLNSVFGKKSGTIILFNTHQVKILNELYDNDGRVIVLDVEIMGVKFHLVNFYVPNESNDRFKFFQNSYKFVMSNFPIILSGDFNTTFDNTLDRYPPRKSADPQAGLFQNLVQTFNLVDLCRFVFPSKKLYTFRTKSNEKCIMSRIDHVLVSPLFKICSFHQNICEHSDHECIVGHVQFESTMLFGKSLWRNNTKLYASDQFLEKFENFWEQSKITRKSQYYGNLNKWWLEFKHDLRRMLSSLGKSTSNAEQREMNMMKHTLDTLLQLMTNFPNNKSCVKNYFDYKKKLSSKQLEINKDKIFRQNAEKCFFGDIPTKEFFEIFKRKSNPKSKMIFEMKDENGVLFKDSHKILEIGQKIY